VGLSDGENALLSHIREARKNREATAPKAKELSVGIEGAYKVQAAMGEGREVLGYKLGLIGPTKQARVGVDSPIYGRVYEDMILAPPVRLRSMVQPRLEPQLAVVLGEKLLPETSPGAAHRAIGGIFLVIDFLNSVWKDYEYGAADVIADNASGGGFLLGERLLIEPLEGNLRLYHNGQPLTEGPVGGSGNVVERSVWLSKIVGGLEAGQTIFLGSPAAAAEAKPGTIELRGPRGSVLVTELQD
jgi:2-keto-4-pentenoate hydratase